MYAPEWWALPDFIFSFTVVFWAGWGMYAVWNLLLWLTPERRRERAMGRINAEYAIRRKRQELEFELLSKEDRHKRNKVFHDSMNKRISKWR
tara:strand:+ start:226 stop:501 length:276 start_codon:yes stop_codon:yes gene_type:complete